MSISRRSVRRTVNPVLTPTCLAMALASVWAADAVAAPASGKPVPKTAESPAPISAEASRSLLRYMVSSGALSLEDVRAAIEQMAAEKKSGDQLLKFLVDSKAITLDDARKLVQQLQGGAPEAAARQPAVAAAPALPPAGASGITASAPATAGAPATVTPTVTAAAPTVTPVPAVPVPAVPAAAEPKPAAEPAGRVRAVYLPDSERQKIREELKQEVLEAARKEGWVQVEAAPEWTRRLKFSGDLTVRQQQDLYGVNDISNVINGVVVKQATPVINYAAINAGSPVNIASPAAGQPLVIPALNSSQDRNLSRMRVRLGVQAQVNDQVDAFLRLSTGNTTNPVSTMQTFGPELNKPALVLDRAWMRFQTAHGFSLSAGRMASPWLAPTELVWDKDLGFDGLATQYRRSWGANGRLFATGGLFSLASTDSNFPGSSLTKVGSHDKRLFGLQFGGDWQKDGLAYRTGLGLYEFQGIEGKLSSACYAPNASVSCDTDHTRATSLQKGNTVFAIRQLQLLNATDPQYQYFGLASPFRVANLNLTIDQAFAGGDHLQFDLEYARNLAFSRQDVVAKGPNNNYGTCTGAGCTPAYDGGDTGYQLQVRYGIPKVVDKGQWNTAFGYRYLESDAVPDAFTDSDFHLGGTNAKGFFVGGNYGLARNTWMGARWLSASEVSGMPLEINVLQLDLNARF